MPVETKIDPRKAPGLPPRLPAAVKAARLIIFISCFMLYFSGLGQLPIYRRYNVVALPGLAWSDQYLITLQLHYLFSAILIGALLFMLVFRYRLSRYGLRQGGNIPAAGGSADFRLFLWRGAGQEGPWQRPARLLIAYNLVLLILTGLVKIYKNLPGVELAYALTVTVTALHNLATVLMLCGVLLYLAGKLAGKTKLQRKGLGRDGGFA